jgi:hypothetical protein
LDALRQGQNLVKMLVNQTIRVGFMFAGKSQSTSILPESFFSSSDKDRSFEGQTKQIIRDSVRLDTRKPDIDNGAV